MNTLNTQKQPPILFVAFFTEMWERFGFYVVQGLLVLFMTHSLNFTDDRSYNILGAFTALAYITPLAGGMLANRVLGFKHAIILGALLLAFGYMILGIQSHYSLYTGLAFISMGNGFFKPNVSVYLGTFYKENDPRRDQGFSIFYAGINMGSLISFSASGYIAKFFGWDATFVVCGIGLILGALTFGLSSYALAKAGKLNQVESQANAPKSTPAQTALIYIGMIIAMVCIGFIIQYEIVANIVLGIGIILLVLFLAKQLIKSDKIYRHHLIVCVILIIASMFYWALYFQMFFSATLFIDRVANHNIFGVTLPTPTFFAIDSLGVIVFGFLFGLMWRRLEERGKDISYPGKFALAFIFMAIVFLCLIISSHFPNAAGLSNAYWIFLGILMFAISELLLSPIGLAVMTRLAPPHLVGMMMGAWLIALGMGGKLASILAHMAAITPTDKSTASITHVYTHTFWIFVILAIIFSAIIFALKPVVKRYIEEGDKARA